MKTTKTILALTFILLVVIKVNATVRTVSNDPAGGAQYNSLQAAYNASTNGDTLLLEGTNINYYFTGCGQAWLKSLTVIGIGINAQKQNPRKTFISATTCLGDVPIGTGGSGIKFMGIEFLASVRIESPTTNLLFENCKFNIRFDFNNQGSSNIAFTNCVFDNNNTTNIDIGGTSGLIMNILIKNCVFDGTINGGNNPFVTMIIDHCIFLDGSFVNLHYTTISNSIFMNTFPGGTGSSTYINNICRVAGTFPPTGLGSNTASGNIEATDPLFVSVAPSTFYSTSHDYALQPGSPGINAGTDGTDLGVHGGTSKFSETGEVLHNPMMRSVIINNTNVAPNGTLNVQIHSSKPNED